MKTRVPVIVAYLVLDVALLVFCVLHLPDLSARMRVPFTVTRHHDIVVIGEVLDAEAAGGARPGDTVTSFAGVPVNRREVLEFLADVHQNEGAVNLGLLHGGGRTSSITVALIPFFSTASLLVFYFVGVVTWCLAVYVALKGPPGTPKRILHAALLSMAVVVMMAWESTPSGALIPRSVTGTLFFASYLGVVVTFVHFTFSFPRPRAIGSPRYMLPLYAGCVLAVVLLRQTQEKAVATLSSADIGIFWKAFEGFQWLVVVGIVAGILSFATAYRRAESIEERRKLQWLLLGLTAGPAPFVAFTLLPSLLISAKGVPEHYTLIFLVIIPASFVVSFVRYQVLDVRLVLSRTTVYAIVIGFLLLCYTAAVGVVTYLVGSYREEVSVPAAVLVGLLFEPVRRRVHRAVDRRFFRIRYDFRLAQRRFTTLLKDCVDVRRLGEVLVGETEKIIPLERIGLFTLHQPEGWLRCVAHRGFEKLERHGLRFEGEKLKTRLDLPVAVPEQLEDGIDHEPADERVFSRWGMVLVFPMLSERFGFLGFLVLGEKSSHTKFTTEDVDLLRTVTTHAGMEVERITLQRELIRTEQEAERLSALNSMKSDFVSYVSHEFVNPLTSIGMFLEYLRKRVPRRDTRAHHYLKVIGGESGRLQRLVSTLLDAARIDQGVKEYSFSCVDLRTAAREALEAMRYQIESSGCRVFFRPGRGSMKVQADPDAVQLAIRNLIANAVKYASSGKHVGVRLRRTAAGVECSVEDRGPGIPREVVPHLFEKFFRNPEHVARVQGVGLGLPLVHNIMVAHGGSVEVRTSPGRGSVFTLVFSQESRDEAATKKNPGD